VIKGEFLTKVEKPLLAQMNADYADKGRKNPCFPR
jgi:hypothetical protein